MPVILWIPGFPEAHDYRVALCEHFLCALCKHTKVNQLFEDAEGKLLTSVMNFCSEPNSIKELGRRLNIHEFVFHSSRGTSSENLQFQLLRDSSDRFKICNSDARRAKASEK